MSRKADAWVGSAERSGPFPSSMTAEQRRRLAAALRKETMRVSFHRPMPDDDGNYWCGQCDTAYPTNGALMYHAEGAHAND